MSTVPESSSERKPTLPLGEYSTRHDSQTLGQAATPWVDYAVEQARTYQKAVEETVESAIEAARSRLSQIRSTSSAHFQQTVVKSNFHSLCIAFVISQEMRNCYSQKLLVRYQKPFNCFVRLFIFFLLMKIWGRKRMKIMRNMFPTVKIQFQWVRFRWVCLSFYLDCSQCFVLIFWEGKGPNCLLVWLIFVYNLVHFECRTLYKMLSPSTVLMRSFYLERLEVFPALVVF